MRPCKRARRQRTATRAGRVTFPTVELLEDRTLPSLIAAFGFDEPIGEGGSTAVFDASGNGNTGTISGADRTAAGRYGWALSFNGTNSWVTVPDANSLDLTTALTVEAWVKPSNLSGWRTVILKEAGTEEV